MPKIQIHEQQRSTRIDPETGEILDVQVVEQIRHVKKVSNYDEFIFVYLNDMSSFLRLDNGTQIKLLSLIWRDVSFNPEGTSEGNVITILKEDKEKWAEEIGVSYGTINNAIPVLVKKDLLISISRSRYKLNPKYFFKGTSKDRSKILRMEINYQIDEVAKEIIAAENIPDKKFDYSSREYIS